MKRVVILGNKRKEGVLRALERLESWLAQRAQVRVDLDMESTVRPEQVDFAVVLGGDGSMLRAARATGGNGVPLLGVNVGKFGFLTEGSVEDAEGLLSCALEGRYRLAERMMLHCVLERDGEPVLDTIGLNDAVVSRTALSRLITVDLCVGGEAVTQYRADGLIVATPVGSTAHSMAAGGPIVDPELQAFVVTPICPHTLSNRPLVLPPDVTLTVAASEAPETPALTVDGQVNCELLPDDVVSVRRAQEPLRLIKTGRQSFFETLRNKLDWRGQPRYVKQ